jgi:hypothetical protein
MDSVSCDFAQDDTLRFAQNNGGAQSAIAAPRLRGEREPRKLFHTKTVARRKADKQKAMYSFVIFA